MTTEQQNDFLQGQRDCRDGVTHKPGKSEYYDRGYAAQYEWEQVYGHWLGELMGH